MKSLPPNYQILPCSISLRIPGFEKTCSPGSKTLALRRRDCAKWYNEFLDRLVDACGRKFLPLCRMSDGEFKFALGEQLPDIRLPWIQRVRQKAKLAIKKRLLRKRQFEAFTGGHYHSGRYSANEWQKAHAQYAQMVQKISKKGILALHLSYGHVPFQEHYFPAFGRWLQKNRIVLTDDNYFPFYFVYAALTGPRRGELLKGRRVLVVNGACGEKRRKIEHGLLREGVAEISWYPISLDRSLYDRLDVDSYIGKIDLALVGAGIGKPNILTQMELLNVPCIDAGYVFEVWADRENRWNRACCVPDEGFDSEKTRF